MGDRSNRALAFIEKYCTLPDPDGGDGSVPFVLDDWEIEFVHGMFETRPDGKLKHTRSLLSVGKKNGKSELGGALVLVFMVGPEARRGAHIFTLAGAKRQSMIIYGRVERMVKAKPELSRLIEITRSAGKMHHRTRLNVFTALPANGRITQGELAQFFIVDEYAQALDDTAYDALDRSQATYKGDGCGLVVSTMSDRVGNPLADLVDAVRKGHAQGLMQHWFMRVYEGRKFKKPDLDAEFGIENVRLANPALGRHLSERVVMQEAEEARLMPSKRQSFRAYRLNRDVDATDALFNMEVWQGLADDGWRVEDLVECECTAGLDLSASQDLTSLALWFEDFGKLWVWSWLPEEILRTRAAEDREPYDVWHEQGHLEVTEGNTIDYPAIVSRIQWARECFHLKTLRYDRWRMPALVLQAAAMGVVFPEGFLVPFGQGFRDMGPAVEKFERLMFSGGMKHPDNPVLNMGVANCHAHVEKSSTSEARKPIKNPKNQKGRIDPAVAALMAVADEPKPTKPPTVITSAAELVMTELHG